MPSKHERFPQWLPFIVYLFCLCFRFRDQWLIHCQAEVEPLWNRLLIFWATEEVPHEVARIMMSNQNFSCCKSCVRTLLDTIHDIDCGWAFILPGRRDMKWSYPPPSIHMVLAPVYSKVYLSELSLCP